MFPLIVITKSSLNTDSTGAQTEVCGSLIAEKLNRKLSLSKTRQGINQTVEVVFTYIDYVLMGVECELYA